MKKMFFITSYFLITSMLFATDTNTFREKIAERATELGYDLSTNEGQQAFRLHKREMIREQAEELGYDLSTNEGRQNFKEYQKNQREEKITNGTNDGKEQVAEMHRFRKQIREQHRNK